jgi:hypothetical protein
VHSHMMHLNISWHGRWQDRDWDVGQTSFPRGHFCSTQDFSENYSHMHREEHQSQYFNQYYTTVYGCVVRFHMADVCDEFLGPGVRDDLTAAFDVYEIAEEQRILTFTIVVISPDHSHDNFFVQHVNNRLVTYMNSIAQHTPDGGRGKFNVHHARSDGCKAQYKCARHFLYISRSQEELGCRLDWSFFCSCHGKVRALT